MKKLIFLIEDLEKIVIYRNRYGHTNNNWDEGFYTGIKYTVEALQDNKDKELYNRLRELLKWTQEI